MFAAVSLALALSGISAALADLRAVVPPSASEPGLIVEVDLPHGLVHAGGIAIPIALDPASRPAAKDVTVETLAIGRAKHLVHVRVPVPGTDAGRPAWEALFASGRSEPVFAGVTGWAAGDPGERTGRALQILAVGDTSDTPDTSDISYALLGEIREDLGICGEPRTLLNPGALYPDSLEFRPATVQRLSLERRQGAQRIEAAAQSRTLDAALAKLLVPRGSSVSGSRGLELTDGDLKTRWVERRPGIGQGEFVVFAAPRGVPIRRMAFVLSRPDVAREPSGAAPRTFYIASPTQTYRVWVPDDGWSRPGQAYEVTFPEPLDSSCVSIVLDDAYGRGLAHPDVGLAEVVAYSEFDRPGGTLADVAKRLSGERGAEAAQVLARAGSAAIDAVAKVYDGLDDTGRALAIDVAASQDPCPSGANLLARGACDGAVEVARKAREKLERCPMAVPALAARLREHAPSRACLAPLLAALAPREALAPIADAIASTLSTSGEAAAASARETRAVLRIAFGDALRAAPPGELAMLLGDAGRSAEARLELMRASGPRLDEARVVADALLDRLSADAPSLRTRYLVLEPLGELARAGDPSAIQRLRTSASSDPDWPVRARAIEGLARVAGAGDTVVERARDPSPRVREAAFAALAEAASAEAATAAVQALSSDAWPFVRERAIGVLGRAPASPASDSALGGALADRSARVRTSAIRALASRRAVGWRDAVRHRLDDSAEATQVRVVAAEALGILCDAQSLDRLGKLVLPLAEPGGDADADELRLAALGALAALHPHDLRNRLAPLLAPSAPPPVRAAAEAALRRPSACR